MSKAWHVGDVAKIAVDFTVGGVNTDPTVVELSVQEPDGTTNTYTYSVGGPVTKDGTGAYHKDILLGTEGTWYWRWRGTGSAAAADEGEILVVPSVFV